VTLARKRPWTKPADLVPKALGVSTADKGPTRDRAYRARIRQMPCIVCLKLGRIQAAPTDPHHPKFIVPSGTLKPTDHFCLPVCRWHHTYGPDALHNAGDEEAWWQALGIDVRAEIAKVSKEGREALAAVDGHGAEPVTESEDGHE
jgi:hypothetical protein